MKQEKSLKKRLEAIEQRADKNRENRKFDEARKEVEVFVAKAEAEYNDPEAVAERKRQYEELQRIGELRHQAFLQGESMDKYPLPWEGELTADEREAQQMLQGLRNAIR